MKARVLAVVLGAALTLSGMPMVPVQAEEQTVNPEGQTVNPEGQTGDSEEQAVNPEGEAGDSEEQTVNPADQAGDSEEQTVNPADQAGDSEEQAGNPEEKAADSLLQNPSFEEWAEDMGNLIGWTLGEGSTAGSVTGKWPGSEENSSQDGSIALNFWSAEAFKADVYQSVDALRAGKYELTAYFYGGTFKEAYLYAQIGQSAEKKKTNITASEGWTAVTVSDIVLGEGETLTVGIYADGEAQSWMFADSVILKKTADEEPVDPPTEENVVSNASFEEVDWDNLYDLKGWTIREGSTENAAYCKYIEGGSKDGEITLSCWAEEDFVTDVYQIVENLEPGYYYLTGYVQNWGGQEDTYLYGQGSGQSASATVLPMSNVPLVTEDQHEEYWVKLPGELPQIPEWRAVTVRGIQVGEDGKATVGLHADSKGGSSLYLDDIKLIRETDQSGQYHFLKGGDISAISWVEAEGGVYRDQEGTAGDPLQLLAENGWNFVRIRLYNNPGKGRGDGTYYCKDGFQDVEDTLELARRAKEKGMQIVYSFHYSDYWSNGGTQIIPSEWQKEIEGLEDEAAVDKLEQLMYDYTYEVMEKLKAQGTTPEYVSLGNEIQGGVLFPYGYSSAATWPNLARFLTAASKAVKASSPESKVIIHLDDAGNYDKYQSFFDNCKKYEVPYDIIGPSYYPYWTYKDVDSIVKFCDDMIKRYDKDIMIMETGYAFNKNIGNTSVESLGQLSHNGCYTNLGDEYGRTPQGQRHFMEDLFNGLKRVGLGTGHSCIGDLYWDPVLLEQEGRIGWALFESTDQPDFNAVSNTTLFDFNHRLLPVMKAYSGNEESTTEGSFSGRIVSSSDSTQGIGNVKAVLTLGGKEYRVTTDKYGAFFLRDIPVGTVQVSVSITGMNYAGGEKAVTITAGETASESFPVTGAAVAGKVTDSEDSPLAGITVYAKNDAGSYTARSGQDGTYRLADIPAGTYEMYAEADGYEASASQKQQLTFGTTTEKVDFQVSLCSGTVRGKVVDEKGSPVAGAKVTAVMKTAARAALESAAAVTGEDGSYELKNLKAGETYQLEVSLRGYVSQTLEVSVKLGETTESEQVVLPSDIGSYTGRIVDVDGVPVEGAEVSVTNLSTAQTVKLTTGKDGVFLFQDQPSGQYTVQVKKEGYMDKLSLEAQISFKETTKAGDVVLLKRVEVVNGGFETPQNAEDKDDKEALGWEIAATSNEANGPAAVRQDRTRFGGTQEGTYGLSLWLNQAFEADVSQKLPQLQAGRYVLRVYSYSNIAQTKEQQFYLYAKDAGGRIAARKELPITGGPEPVDLEFELDGKGCTIGFYAKTVGETWAVLDQVELAYAGAPSEPDDPDDPDSTQKPDPTVTPEPSATPEATATPEPSTTPEATATPEPSTSPEPSGTPEPPQTSTPSPTPGNGDKVGDLTYEDGSFYFYEDGQKAVSKEAYVNGAWRWFDADGTMAADKDVYLGSSGGKWVRYDENGEMVKGQDYRDGAWYCFESVTGAMVKGAAVLEDGRKVFYDPVTGRMAKGEVEINGVTCCFDETDGHLVSGEPGNFWVHADGKDFWYEGWQRQGWNPAEDGYRGKEIYDPATDGWYWLDSVLNGAKAVSKDVYQESASAYPDRPDGTGKWVRYDENGRMVKGWHTTEAGEYYFEPVTGAMAKGNVVIDGRTYHFDEITGIRYQEKAENGQRKH